MYINIEHLVAFVSDPDCLTSMSMPMSVDSMLVSFGKLNWELRIGLKWIELNRWRILEGRSWIFRVQLASLCLESLSASWIAFDLGLDGFSQAQSVSSWLWAENFQAYSSLTLTLIPISCLLSEYLACLLASSLTIWIIQWTFVHTSCLLESDQLEKGTQLKGLLVRAFDIESEALDDYNENKEHAWTHLQV